MNYTIPEDIDRNMIFVINRSDIKGRLDPGVYKESFKYVSLIYPNVKLSEIAYLNPETSFSNLCEEDEVSFVPMENINEHDGDIIAYGNIKIIDSRGYTRFQENDLLWAKITPCMQNGKSAIARNLKNGLGCGSTEFHVIRAKTNLVLIDYLHILLHSEKVLYSAQNYFSGAAGQQRVSQSFLEDFSTPIPPREVQETIVEMLTSATKRKKEKKRHAKELLESVDAFLLGILNISSNNTLNQSNKSGTTFFVPFCDVSGGRLDPLYYYANIKEYTHCTYSEKLSSLTFSFINGFAVGRQDQVEEEEGVLQIRPTNIDNNGRLKYDKNVYVPEMKDVPFVESGVVLFNNTNSQEWVGKTAYFANEENRKVYTSNHITAIEVDRSKILPEYLCAILNMYQRHKIFYSICTNWNNQSGIGLDLLKSLHIPLFTNDRKESLRRQQEIVDRINAIYKEADECILSANQIMNEAKAKVESMIIGE